MSSDYSIWYILGFCLLPAIYYQIKIWKCVSDSPNVPEWYFHPVLGYIIDCRKLQEVKEIKENNLEIRRVVITPDQLLELLAEAYEFKDLDEIIIGPDPSKQPNISTISNEERMT